MDPKLEPAGAARAPSRRSLPGLSRFRAAAGFTLIELMVVVAIIGILVAVAVPNFMRYVYKARRSEAFVALKTVHDLQVGYYGENAEYSDSFDQLGFDLEGGTLLGDGSIQAVYYTYTLQNWDVNGISNANYRATATGDIDPTDAILDIVIIENNLTVVE